MKRSLMAGLLGVAVAACNTSDERVIFNGAYFRTKAAPVDRRATRAVFDVTVRDVTQSIEGAREAGRYEGTRYCIEKYGTSRIQWSVSPDAEASQLQIRDGQMFFRGRCRP